MHDHMPARRLHGGLRLPASKEESTAGPLRRGLLPGRVILSLRQGRGPAAVPLVEVGRRVLRDELIAAPDSAHGNFVHASTSGTVTAIEPHVVPSFAGPATELCIVIEADGLDRRRAATGRLWPSDRDDRLTRVAEGGIVGLGGAVFPTASKLAAEGCHTLIVNGAECEPYISCDDMLMRERAEEVAGGTEIMAAIVGATTSIIAIERDKPAAIAAIRAALARHGSESIELAELPTIYPAGAERQLIEILAAVQVPVPHYPTDSGFICQNVATAAAVWRLATGDEPLTRRIVTVSGGAVAEPCNVEVPIGTPIVELIDFCGGYEGAAVRLVHGGSMMGYALPSDALPVTKATNCLIVAAPGELRDSFADWPCIRCAECAIACPARLLPQDLLAAASARDVSALAQQGLTACIECGCCDVVCPSQIPLTQTFRQAKQTLGAWQEEQAFSARAETRFQQRQARERETASREETRHSSLKQLISEPDKRQEAIAAAVARARKRRSEHEGRGK